MKRLRYIFALIFALLALYGCQKEEEIPETAGGGFLTLNASVDNSIIQSDTRSVAYYGTYFVSGKILGLSICVNETNPANFIPFQIGTGNLKVTSKNTSSSTKNWEYYNSVTKNTVTQLWLSTRPDSAMAAIYGYTPYNATVTDLRSIQVDFSDNKDLMWAKENGVGNKGLNPAVSVAANLNFEHMLSLLRIGIKLENKGSNHLLNYMTLLKSGSKSTPIDSLGTFNAIQGVISILTQSDSLRVTYGGTDSRYENYGLFSNASDYTYFDFLIHPTDLAADDDLTLVMCIDGFRYSYSIKKADVLHSDDTTYGFQKGYSYKFLFKLDNYVHLKGVTIQQGWTAEDISDVI